MDDVPTVLFVCVDNAGRSQMAAAFLLHLAGDTAHVRSAGPTPADRVHPLAAEVMREVGIDLGTATPTLLDPDTVRISDVVVTMGCDDVCPVFAGTRYLDWAVSDPDGRDLGSVRNIRDDIRHRVEQLLAELPVDAP